MRIYISGPMTGIHDHNRKTFNEAALRLMEQGHFVINPCCISVLFGDPEEVGDSFKCLYEGVSQVENRTSQLARAVMDADLAALRSCDAIYLLRGWETSRGARRELKEALEHGLTIMQEGAEG